MKPLICRLGLATFLLAIIICFLPASFMFGQDSGIDTSSMPTPNSNFQTWWLNLLIIGLIATGIVAYYQWKTAKLRRQKDALDKLVKEQSEEIIQREELIKKEDISTSRKSTHLPRLESTANISHEDLIWLKQFETLASANLNNPNFKAQELANALNLSRTQCFRKLKGITGMTPGAWLQEARLQKALKLLEGRSCDSVKAVAYEVGINPNYFSEAFKKRFGKLPSEYF